MTYESFVVGFSMIFSWGYVISDLVRTLTSPERYQPHHLAQHPGLRKNSPIFLLQGKMPGWARRTRTVPWQHRQFLIAERGGRESSSTSRCRELYIHEMFLLSSHLNVTCLPIPFFFIFSNPKFSSLSETYEKDVVLCVTRSFRFNNGTRLGVDPRSSHGTERCNALCHVFGERNPYYIGWGPRFRWWTLLPFEGTWHMQGLHVVDDFYLGICSPKKMLTCSEDSMWIFGKGVGWSQGERASWARGGQ